MNSNKTKVVITGASGFLGRNLVTYLDKNDQYVIYALSSQSKILQDKNRYKNVKYYDKNAIFTDQDKLILENAILTILFGKKRGCSYRRYPGMFGNDICSWKICNGTDARKYITRNGYLLYKY